ncbi:MAG: cupredoxin domain-containing protein [Sulfurifustis sp.]
MPMRVRSRIALGLIALALGLLVAPRVVRAEDLYAVTLVAKDGHFFPETLRVPAGRKFKIVIRNEGQGPEEFENVELKREKVLPAGATSFLVFAPLKPGVYPFFGEFHPETAKGRIVVE